MAPKRLNSLLKKFEDPKRPLLGPNIKGLHLIGLWRSKSRTRNFMFNIFFAMWAVFIISEIYGLYLEKHDLNMVLSNVYLTAPSIICGFKAMTFVFWQSRWRKLINEISHEETRQIEKQNIKIINVMTKYTIYARNLTYYYCMLVFITIVSFVVMPLLKYISNSSYRDDIKQGIEPYPKILLSWFPFDDSKMPGYIFAIAYQDICSIEGSAVTALFDANAVVIMTFLKGQLSILKSKCMDIFEGETNNANDYIARIIECHRHHNFIVKQCNSLNFLLSPVMFVYVLLCSITICCSVIQLTLGDDVSASQKLWIIQFSIGELCELLIYCWHANDIFVESEGVDGGIFASNWWKADVRIRRQLLLLSGKLNQPLLLKAGPFMYLSVPTFLSLIKGSYSFYTLISQMHADN